MDQEHQTLYKLCLHCNENQQFNKDFLPADVEEFDKVSIKTTKSQPVPGFIKNKSQKFQSLEEDKQVPPDDMSHDGFNNLTSITSSKDVKKRDAKHEEKLNLSFMKQNKRKGPKFTTNSYFTDFSSNFNVRFDTVERETSQLKEMIRQFQKQIAEQQRTIQLLSTQLNSFINDKQYRKEETLTLIQSSQLQKASVGYDNRTQNIQYVLDNDQMKDGNDANLDEKQMLSNDAKINDVINDASQDVIKMLSVDVMSNDANPDVIIDVNTMLIKDAKSKDVKSDVINDVKQMSTQKVQGCAANADSNNENMEEAKGSQFLNNYSTSILKQSQWKTWLKLKINEIEPDINGTSRIQIRGEDRRDTHKGGIEFTNIVNNLIKLVKLNLDVEEYKTQVRETLVGSQIVQGFKIKDVIGAGNTGTILLVLDQQKQTDVILKVYHKSNQLAPGIHEFKMLNLVKFAPHSVKAYSLMYNNHGKFVAISLQNLSNYKTLYTVCNECKLNRTLKLLIARNICVAVAELHSIKIIHGDLASENILIDVNSGDAKLIDFDISAREGEKLKAAGNVDFASPQLLNALTNAKKIITSTINDLYALGLCCFMILGDAKQKFFESLSADVSLLHDQRIQIIQEDKYAGQQIILKLLNGEISAANAAEEINKLLIITVQ